MTDSGRRFLMAGNWKMYKTHQEAAEYITRLAGFLKAPLKVDVVLAPTFTSLQAALDAAQGTPIEIAAQNVFWEPEGAFTGEISVAMLAALGIHKVILGHSERRQYFGETNETVNRRVLAALAGGLDPILCIGETLEEREGEQTFAVLENQIEVGLQNVDPAQAARLTLAYEPVWAIGTGRTATPDLAQEAHAFIRQRIEKRFDKNLANSIRILYGGSVKPENVTELMSREDIDGALVGGASLKPDVFEKIINHG